MSTVRKKNKRVLCGGSAGAHMIVQLSRNWGGTTGASRTSIMRFFFILGAIFANDPSTGLKGKRKVYARRAMGESESK